MKPMLYFAYGSNMWQLRLEERIGPCHPVGTARLDGYTLRFHKDGRDGSGKCNAYHTGLAADRMYGAVFEIDLMQKTRLDVFEGSGYRARAVNVQSPLGDLEAFTYVALDAALNPQARPFTWYKALVLEGALQHALPDEYVETIRCVEPVPDPQPERAARHEALLPKKGDRSISL